jgi:aminoglycoside phosphotransferase (APT) family kinase protein
MSDFTLIPESKHDAVRRALQTAFNTPVIDSITLLTGGLSSSLVYKIVVNGTPYVLRIVMHAEAFNDPVRQYLCMNRAAAVGIAPHVYYSNAADALAITAFIEGQPFPQSGTLHLQLADVIKAIHATPAFPPLVNFLDGVDIFIQNFKAAQLLPASATEEHFRLYAQIQERYPRHDPDLVSSHNDLNRGNLIYDGSKIWVLDWEAAFLNDRYVDLAIVGKAFAPDAAHEEAFLAAYFGAPPTDIQRARYFLMVQITHFYYGMIMLNMIAAARAGGFVPDPSMDTPTMAEFHRDLGTGTRSLHSLENQLLYGKVMLNEALRNMQSPRFAESLALMPVTVN